MTVRLNGTDRGFRSTMPSSIARRHEDPRYGDTQSAIRRSEGKALDINWHVVKVLWGRDLTPRYLPVAGHWAKVGKDGYTHTTQGKQKGLRPLTEAEKRLTYQQWIDRHGGTRSALQMLRKRGTSSKKVTPADYPMDWDQAVRYATKHGAVLIPELKSTRFAFGSVVAYMVATCEKYDYPLWPMTLIWLPKAEEKVNAFVEAGAQIALIFGSKRRLAAGPNLIAQWDNEPTRIWGPAFARRWLR